MISLGEIVQRTELKFKPNATPWIERRRKWEYLWCVGTLVRFSCVYLTDIQDKFDNTGLQNKITRDFLYSH